MVVLLGMPQMTVSRCLSIINKFDSFVSLPLVNRQLQNIDLARKNADIAHFRSMNQLRRIYLKFCQVSMCCL